MSGVSFQKDTKESKPATPRDSKSTVFSTNLLDMSPATYLKLFGRAASRVGVGRLHPHQLRHGGASHDSLHALRSRQEVQHRGRWADDRSVRRYAKLSRAQAELAKLSSEQIGLAQAIERQAGACFHQPALARDFFLRYLGV